MTNANRNQFQISYEISPIILVAGIAQGMPGNMLPIICILQSADFSDGILTGPTTDISYNNTFATFKVMSGGTLVSNQIGKYPFANQTVAANAIISQPLNISVEMHCPPRMTGDQIARNAVISNLKESLDNHNASGGYYALATPAYLYQNLILTSLRDITGGDTKNSQVAFQWDFEAPLITQDDTEGSTSALMSTLENFLPPGTPPGTTPGWSGLQSTIGRAITGAIVSRVPAAQKLVGAIPLAQNAVTIASSVGTAASNEWKAFFS